VNEAAAPGTTIVSLSVHVEDLADPGQSRYEDSQAPGWDAVEAAVRRLDGASYDGISLGRWLAGATSEDPGETLYVDGGGRDRVYVMHMSDSGEGTVSFRLVEKARGDALEWGVAGSQGVDYPARFWVTKELALRAVRHLFEQGGRDPELEWEPDTTGR
jgi:hypothetical protein